MAHPTYDEWFASLSAERQAQTSKLVATFRELGCDDPEGWARSEISRNIAQLARFLVLRRIWETEIDMRRSEVWISNNIKYATADPHRPFADAGLALARILQSGVATADITAIARMIAYETAFGLLYRIGQGCDPDASAGLPGWALVETDAEGRPTGRDVGGLYESLLSMDPSGREGRPASGMGVTKH